MTRVFHWFRAFRLWAGHMPLCPPSAPDWTEQDASALGVFFRTKPAGRKLVLLLRYQEQVINASAVTRNTGCEYNCGYAAGFRAAAAMLEKLSANVPPHPDDASQDHEGADDLAERFAP